MEDALVQSDGDADINKTAGLNPCFNGRCTRTYAQHLPKRLGGMS